MTQTSTIRLTQPTVGGDSGTWGTKVNDDLTYIDEAVNQTISVAVPDANVVLLADGSSGDQARYLRYNFTGALTANRTITLPGNAKFGYATNATTGGFSLTLTTGSGRTVSIKNHSWTLFQCDGTNVDAPPLAFGGTTTNDDAVAGTVGQYLETVVSIDDAFGITSGVTTNIMDRELTAGDWDVWGSLGLIIASVASATLQAGLTTTALTFPTLPGGGACIYGQIESNGTGILVPLGMRRISLAATTTVHLIASVGFNCSAYGMIGARRPR